MWPVTERINWPSGKHNSGAGYAAGGAVTVSSQRVLEPQSPSWVSASVPLLCPPHCAVCREGGLGWSGLWEVLLDAEDRGSVGSWAWALGSQSEHLSAEGGEGIQSATMSLHWAYLCCFPLIGSPA
jgi:hypothetical protein